VGFLRARAHLSEKEENFREKEENFVARLKSKSDPTRQKPVVCSGPRSDKAVVLGIE
jgi:hypothetical protein